MHNRIAATLAIMLAMTGGAQAATVTISDGWFRALPPSVPSGGYFTLRNGRDKAITVTDVESPACGMLMMHKSENGSMEHVMALDVAAGKSIVFAPNGYHLMCMDSKPVLKPGATVPVTFLFKDGAKVTSDFRVRNAAGK